MTIESRVNEAACGLAGFALLLAVWQLCTTYQFVSPVFLPSPMTTFVALRRGLTNGEHGPQFVATVMRMLQGWVAASLVAIAIGSLIGISERARAYLQPTLEFLRPLPAPAVIPVAIALLGLTHTMVLVVIVFGSLWPALLATVYGFASVEPRLVEVSRIMRLSRFAFVVKIGLPNAVPDIIAGMRLSLTISLILSVVCEMLAGETGLGTGILLAARSFRAGDLFAGVILLGLIGFFSNYALVLVEHRVLAWRQ